MSKNTKGRILVVDDDEALRTILSTELSTAGYDVISASDGDEAISFLRKNNFDVALLDIKMPGVDGIEVLKFLHKNFPRMKVIMLTGFADLKHAMEAKEFGARDFITKPYRLEDVLSTIENVLRE